MPTFDLGIIMKTVRSRKILTAFTFNSHWIKSYEPSNKNDALSLFIKAWGVNG